MKISFHGAAQHVTGSKHLLHLDNGKKVLLDCGLFQGRRREAEKLNQHWGFEPRDVDYLLLSHAHIDHCGLIPKLVKDGFRGKVYCTPATYDLCKVMIPDSAHIQEADAFYDNKRRRQEGRELVKPLYTIEDAADSLTYFRTVEFEETFRLNDCGLEFTFIENGHLLGSGCIYIVVNENEKETRLCFTGDIGREKPHMLRPPKPFPQADYIISESTYGDRLHADEHYTPDDLIKIVEDTLLVNKGKLIIPAFSIGRTQEVLFALDYLQHHSHIPNIKVFVDSPLSTQGTDIHRRHLELFNDEMQAYFKQDPTPFDFPRLEFVETAEESKRLNTYEGPCVIISASGMMDAGRIRHHIFNHIENPKNTLLIVGYCEPSTLGGRIIRGDKEIKLFGQVREVKARIEYLRSFSGHGDYEEMIHYLSCQKPEEVKKLFLVHGEPDVEEIFSIHLKDAGFKRIEIPAPGMEYHL